VSVANEAELPGRPRDRLPSGLRRPRDSYLLLTLARSCRLTPPIRPRWVVQFLLKNVGESISHRCSPMNADVDDPPVRRQRPICMSPMSVGRSRANTRWQLFRHVNSPKFDRNVANRAFCTVGVFSVNRSDSPRGCCAVYVRCASTKEPVTVVIV